MDRSDPVEQPPADLDSPRPVIQRKPLEAVWPVDEVTGGAALGVEERGGEPRPSPASAGQVVQRAAAPAAGTEPPPVGQAADTVHDTLRQVRPGQASDSSVELVPVRRPRPAGPPAVDAVQAKRAEPPVLPEPPIPLEAPLPDELATLEAAGRSAEPALPQARADGEQLPHAPAARFPAPEVQRQPADSAGEVDTPIGPLPADLWTLIGQPAPAPGRAEEGAKRAPETASRKTEPVPAQPAGLAGASGLAGATELAGALGLIQREVAVDMPAEGSGGEDRRGEPDLDQLTRRVYAEVRRRLQQEWERLRR